MYYALFPGQSFPRFEASKIARELFDIEISLDNDPLGCVDQYEFDSLPRRSTCSSRPSLASARSRRAIIARRLM